MNYSFSLQRSSFKSLDEFLGELKNRKTCPIYGGVHSDTKSLGVFNNCNKIIAIGDIHGDFEVLVEALLKGKVIDERTGEWCGGDTIVVQVGDFLDRGGRPNSIDSITQNEELDISQFMENLNIQARSEGGAFLTLVGNHELMNVLGDFRYTSKNTLQDFGGIEKRKQLFQPGGLLSKHLSCTCYGIIKIGDWIFVHGGLLPQHLNGFTIHEVNMLIKDILSGNKQISSLQKKEQDLIFSQDGILWTRDLIHKQDKCNNVLTCLNILNNNTNGGVVIGHTVQDEINSDCNNKLWKIDTGPSSAFGPIKNVQVLEIIQNGKKINVIT